MKITITIDDGVVSVAVDNAERVRVAGSPEPEPAAERPAGVIDLSWVDDDGASL